MNKSAAIIIVTYNGEKWIKPCLDSVFKTDYPGGFKVIVVDNASSDKTIEVLAQNFNVISTGRLRRPPSGEIACPAQKQQARDFSTHLSTSSVEMTRNITLIVNTANTGFTGGNNIGLARALAEDFAYCVLLNQDTKVEPNWLGEMVRAADEETGIVQGMLVLGEERGLVNNVGNVLHYLGFGYVGHYRDLREKWENKKPFAIGYASGAAMLIKREVLEKLTISRHPERSEGSQDSTPRSFGLPQDDAYFFDPKFFAYHEDLDLCWRARLLGYKIMLAPGATVYHYYQFSRNKKLFYWTERNRWLVLLRNYSLKTLLLLAPMLAVIEIMMLGFAFLSGWGHHKLKSYFWLLGNSAGIIRRRRYIQKTRVATDRDVLSHMSSKLDFAEINNPILRYAVNPLVALYYQLVKGLI